MACDAGRCVVEGREGVACVGPRACRRVLFFRVLVVVRAVTYCRVHVLSWGCLVLGCSGAFVRVVYQRSPCVTFRPEAFDLSCVCTRELFVCLVLEYHGAPAASLTGTLNNMMRLKISR